VVCSHDIPLPEPFSIPFSSPVIDPIVNRRIDPKANIELIEDFMKSPCIEMIYPPDESGCLLKS
jgi:hypothetical protein